MTKRKKKRKGLRKPRYKEAWGLYDLPTKRPYFGPCRPAQELRTLAAACVLRCRDGSMAAACLVVPGKAPGCIYQTVYIGRDLKAFWHAVRTCKADIILVSDLDRFAACSFDQPYGFPDELIPRKLSPNGRILAWRWCRKGEGGKGKKQRRRYQKVVGLSDHLARSIPAIDTFEGWLPEPLEQPLAHCVESYVPTSREEHCKDVYRRAEAIMNLGERLRNTYWHLGADFKQTRGSTALSLYRSCYVGRFKSNYWRLPSKRVLSYLRKAYYGGRCEVFRNKNVQGPVYLCDRNSAYAHAMTVVDLPTPDGAWSINFYEHPQRVITSWRRWPGVVSARVVVDTVGGLHGPPPLPFHGNDGKAVYPEGLLEGEWATNELAYAESIGSVTVLEITGGILWPKRRPYLAEIARDLYALRQVDDWHKAIGKGLLTSLAGKWAQRSGLTVDLFPASARPDKPGMGEVWRPWPSKQKPVFALRTTTGGSEQGHANVLWSILINAEARIVLHRQLVEVDPARLIYCHTDSIVALDPIVSDDQTALGAWRVDQVAEWFEAKARDIYQYGKADGDTVQVCSGFTPAEVPQVFRQGVIARLHSLGFAEALALGTAPGLAMTYERTLSFPTPEPTRWFKPDGTSRPYFLGDPAEAVAAMAELADRKKKEADELAERVKSIACTARLRPLKKRVTL